MSAPLVFNVHDLMRRAGNERHVDTSLSLTELGVDDPRFTPHTMVTLALHAESLSDGVVVHGSVAVPWTNTCARCLAVADGTAVTEVHELYQLVVTDPDAFPIDGEQIDLTPFVRDVVLLDTPTVVLCRPDCAGLCPTCGVDRNATTCHCAPTPADDRWAGLDVLRTRLGDESADPSVGTENADLA